MTGWRREIFRHEKTQWGVQNSCRERVWEKLAKDVLSPGRDVKGPREEGREIFRLRVRERTLSWQYGNQSHLRRVDIEAL